jgi:hypothetical protein
MWRTGLALLAFCGVAEAAGHLLVQPERIELKGADRLHGLLVTRVDPDGRKTDVTASAKFSSAAPTIVTVNTTGECRAVMDGETQIEVRVGDQVQQVAVLVANVSEPVAPSFRQDILPILTKTGCNAGGCHGKLAGQNGFRLSLRGYAPEWDHDWVTKEVNGRRLNVAFPEQSLLVQKPVGGVAHEGGTRFKTNSRYYSTLVDWVAARAPGPVADEADAVRLEVLPGDRQMQPGDSQKLLVRAHYPNGRVRDVTWLAQIFSNDEATLAVKPNAASVKALRCGEASVRVHFQGQVEVVRFTMPFPTEVEPGQFAPRQNQLDGPIFDKLAALRIPPSPLCDDQTFIRRAYLDAIGVLPTPEETTAFLADSRPDRRAQLVEQLLTRPEWTDYWTLQLADLMQNRKERDHDVRGTKGVRAFHSWLRAQVAKNRPWNELARSVLLARGDSVKNPEIGYYITVIGEKRNVEDSELPDSVAQSFLGTRVGCARCHNHPLEKYTQDDFYHFSAYFSKVSLKRVEPAKGATELNTTSREEQEAAEKLVEAKEKLLEAQTVALSFGEEPGGEEPTKKAAEAKKQVESMTKRIAELRTRQPSVNQPRTNKQMAPQPLDRAPWKFEPDRDPREQFVDWMLGSENFSGAMVNRIWKHFFSVGLVEPADDLRASNPPSNGELWKVLNREFVDHGYDLNHVMRLILNSRAYQLRSGTLPGNETETRFYSHYYARRLPAEVLTDAIAGATDVPTKYDGYPLGTRAVQLPEPSVSSYFLTLFGRSERVTACACERSGEVTLPQLLHLHNSDELQQRITHPDGRLTALLKNPDDAAVCSSIFLTTVNRPPTDRERETVRASLAADKREDVFRDLFWALLNAKDFAFNH